jgi:phage terminase large subunit GpA-like protein
MVPCPYCGKYQWLDHDATAENRHGLRGDFEAGRLINVYYLCDFCHDPIQNHHKGAMLRDGVWEPQTRSTDPLRRSYQLSSLYSPAGMLTWLSYYKQYLEAMDMPDGMRSFTNLYKGMPYRETGAKPVLQNVIELRGAYAENTVPDGVLFLTLGLDVQRGSSKDKENPARIELEIVGHGVGYRTWSICYKVFKGPVDDPAAGAWAKLQAFAESGGFHFEHYNGGQISPSMIFMDANDNYSTAAVYEFTSGWPNSFPIRGASQLKKRKGEKADRVDEYSASNVKKFRWVKADNDISVVMISTAYYKKILYRRLKVQRVDGPEQRVGYCDFPITYNDNYFKGLTAEEALADGSFHCPSGRPNEPMDCRVYAMCAADVWLDQQVTKLRNWGKKRGLKDHQIQAYNSKSVLNELEKRYGKK